MVLSKYEHLISKIKLDIKNKKFIEGIFLRPFVTLSGVLLFFTAIYLIIIGELKWGGSLIIMSFLINLSSIYDSLIDKTSIYRNLNLNFKFFMLIFEVAAFNYILFLIK